MAEYIEREAVMNALLNEQYGYLCEDAIKSIPAADVPPLPLWTDEPISGTEFMTHNQGQSGFEIHFQTDDKAKYEAVQDECRRQIGHAKPAADVRPVVLCRDCKQYSGRPWENNEIGICVRTDFGVGEDDFCSYGVKREES